MLRIAKVLKSNGIDGGLLIGAREVDLQEITEPVFVEFDGLPVPFFILDCTPKGQDKYIVHLNDVRNLQDAEEMVGRDVYFDGEFEQEDSEPSFEGWQVFDRGALLGKVSGEEPIPGNFCIYVARSDGDEILIPLHPDFVISADKKRRELRLALPSGLY